MAKKYLFLKEELSKINDLKQTIVALEKISAANLHNLKVFSQNMKQYEKEIKRFLFQIKNENPSHPIFLKNSSFGRLNVVITPEKGLCNRLDEKVLDFLKQHVSDRDENLIIGRKGKEVGERVKIKIDYFFEIKKHFPQKEQIMKVNHFLFKKFLKKQAGEIWIFYVEFKSLNFQTPNSVLFLPFLETQFQNEKFKKSFLGEPIFEPSKSEVFDYLTKEYLGLFLYQKFIETKLSELSARTFVLERAGERIDSLIHQLSYKQKREKRESITKSLIDLYSHYHYEK